MNTVADVCEDYVESTGTSDLSYCLTVGCIITGLAADGDGV